MRNLFIVDIEPLDNRYTKQWQEWIPQLARDTIGDSFTIVPVAGHTQGYDKPSSGAFFDFSATCDYKASQAQRISQLFSAGEVKPDDVFFFTDAWNQTIHTVKYISELNDVPVKIAGIFHAGAYDPTDILALRIKNKEWVYELERSYFHALDMAFFATQQHLDKFLVNLDLNTPRGHSKSYVCGYPLEYIKDLRNTALKTNTVVFPHRLNEDKAPQVFDLLETYVRDKFNRPDIVFAKTQSMNMGKDEYYSFLMTCKVVFSANKHENLGIGTFEAMTAGCLPIVPNKLSYAEMYSPCFKYDIEEEIDLYTHTGLYADKLARMIIEYVDNYDTLYNQWDDDVTRIQNDFFSGDRMMNLLSNI